jgi:hypothetical protein
VHWDGRNLHTMRPAVQGATLDAVAAVTTDDVWAVGWDARDGAPALHWDGGDWTRSKLPDNLDGLDAVVAVSPRDVWAVGWFESIPEVLHWDGARWRLFPAGGDNGVR